MKRTEKDVLTDVLAQKAAKMSLRNIGDTYGKPVTHNDIGRILHGIFPKGKGKRAALHLPPICPACRRRVPRPRVTSDWPLDEAVANLKRLLELKKGINHVEETETI